MSGSASLRRLDEEDHSGPRRKGLQVKYMLLIYSSPATWNALSEPERDAFAAEHAALHAEIMGSGEWVGGDALADPTQSWAVRVRDGALFTTEGPYAETREHVAGYTLIDVDALDRALEIAARLPDSGLCGVEVRPIMHDGGLEM